MTLPGFTRAATRLTTVLVLALSAGCAMKRGDDATSTTPMRTDAPDPAQHWRDSQARELQRRKIAVSAKPKVKPRT